MACITYKIGCFEVHYTINNRAEVGKMYGHQKINVGIS